jgi:hypothetical protein
LEKKSQWYHNCFQFLLSASARTLPPPTSLEEESREKEKPTLKQKNPEKHSAQTDQTPHSAHASSPFDIARQHCRRWKTPSSSQPWLANPREWPGVPNFIIGPVEGLKAIKQKNVSLESLQGIKRCKLSGLIKI